MSSALKYRDCLGCVVLMCGLVSCQPAKARPAAPLVTSTIKPSQSKPTHCEGFDLTEVSKHIQAKHYTFYVRNATRASRRPHYSWYAANDQMEQVDWFDVVTTSGGVLVLLGEGTCRVVDRLDVGARYKRVDLSPDGRHLWMDWVDPASQALRLSVYSKQKSALVVEDEIHDSYPMTPILRTWKKGRARLYQWSAGSGLTTDCLCTFADGCTCR